MSGNSQWARFGRSVVAGAALVLGASSALQAQGIICDLDIHDNAGTFVSGNTIHLFGRVGAGTNVGRFVISNGNNVDTDYDGDGFSGTCGFSSLFVRFRTPLVNVSNPSLAIPSENIVVTRLPRQLPNGTQALVDVNVILSNGTPAGRYIGRITVEDSLFGVRNTPTGEVYARDEIFIEVIVQEQPDLALVDANSPTRLDSLVLRARAGQRTGGVLRVANAGNAGLSDLRLSASDLRSESAVGLVIPSTAILFSPPNFAGLPFSDTVRVTVTVQVPRGILGGRYRGTLTVQASGTESETIPLIVIVTSSRGIQFANNPVREGIATIAFNGDPGSVYKVGIYDMSGLMVHVEFGSVFAGVGGSVTNPTSGADFAAAVLWPLINGRGENVASGLYLVVVESIVNGKRQQASDRLMVIR